MNLGSVACRLIQRSRKSCPTFLLAGKDAGDALSSRMQIKSCAYCAKLPGWFEGRMVIPKK